VRLRGTKQSNLRHAQEIAAIEIAAIEIAAIEIASQKPLAMTPSKILAISANVGG